MKQSLKILGLLIFVGLLIFLSHTQMPRMVSPVSEQFSFVETRLPHLKKIEIVENETISIDSLIGMAALNRKNIPLTDLQMFIKNSQAEASAYILSKKGEIVYFVVPEGQQTAFVALQKYVTSPDLYTKPASIEFNMAGFEVKWQKSQKAIIAMSGAMILLLSASLVLMRSLLNDYRSTHVAYPQHHPSHA